MRYNDVLGLLDSRKNNRNTESVKNILSRMKDYDDPYNYDVLQEVFKYQDLDDNDVFVELHKFISKSKSSNTPIKQMLPSIISNMSTNYSIIDYESLQCLYSIYLNNNKVDVLVRCILMLSNINGDWGLIGTGYKDGLLLLLANVFLINCNYPLLPPSIASSEVIDSAITTSTNTDGLVSKLIPYLTEVLVGTWSEVY